MTRESEQYSPCLGASVECGRDIPYASGPVPASRQDAASIGVPHGLQDGIVGRGHSEHLGSGLRVRRSRGVPDPHRAVVAGGEDAVLVWAPDSSHAPGVADDSGSLLGKSHPVGVLVSALLFGFLRAGAQRMQAPPASVPVDIIMVLQGLIIIFVAAPEVIRFIYRLRAPKEVSEAVLTRGWGQV